jgi:hypothetical protein
MFILLVKHSMFRPVTVPILIAFGVGAGSNRTAASAESEARSLEGFGIVTIAALVPVITVVLQGLLLAYLYPSEVILSEELATNKEAPSSTGGISIIDMTPWRETVKWRRKCFVFCSTNKSFFRLSVCDRCCRWRCFSC